MAEYYHAEPLTGSRHPSEIHDGTIEEVCRRVDDLAHLNMHQRLDRSRIRDLMDGGIEGFSRLVGKDLTKDPADLPVANQLLIANNRLAQKLGHRPDVKVDPPVSHDSDRARRHAEKRTRILESWDGNARLKLQLPQAARWLPGYGFAVWTIKQKKKYGDPYPHMSLRDSYNCYPGNFGTDQSPLDVAFAYKIPAEQLARMYPEHAQKLMDYASGASGFAPGSINSRSPLLTPNDGGRPSWTSQGGQGLDVYEYINDDGTWWVVPDCKLLLAYVPNPLTSGPSFVFAKRFSFSALRGQYDHAIGLLSGIARLNVLSIMAAEDMVFAETNIAGEVQSGEYKRGRKAVNKLRPGTQVIKMNERMPFEVFQQLDRLEGQLRAQASYPVQDDGRSPMSFVTGRGMNELQGAVDLEVNEYQTVFSFALEEGDTKRFEWAEKLYPGRTLKITGMTGGSPFAETYKPSTHIAGHWASRRVYGIMAGWDEPNKIIGGLNLLSARIIDRNTMRENIDGLENHSKIVERIRSEQIEEGLFAGLAARAERGDPLTLTAMIKMLPDGDMKTLLTEVYLKPLEEQQDQMAEDPMMGGMEGPPPDVQTLLQQMSTNRDPMMGVQNVATL